MKMSVKNTKVICTLRQKNKDNLIEGQRVEEVDEFEYLGDLTGRPNAYCKKDVRNIAIGIDIK